MIESWGGDTIAQWIRLRLQSCGPGGFKSQRHHIHFYIAKFCDPFEMDEYKQKEVGFGPYLKKPDRE